MAGSTTVPEVPVVEAPPPPQGAVEVNLGLKPGDIDFAVYFPDGQLPPVARLLRAVPEIHTIQCAREDQCIAKSASAYLASGPGSTSCLQPAISSAR